MANGVVGGIGLLKSRSSNIERHVSIDPDDMEFKDTMTNAGKSRKCLWNPTCLALLLLIMVTREAKKQLSEDKIRIIEAHESTSTRIGTTQLRDHQDLLAEMGLQSLSYHHLANRYHDGRRDTILGCHKQER